MKPTLKKIRPVCISCNSESDPDDLHCGCCAQRIGPGYKPVHPGLFRRAKGLCHFCGGPSYASLEDLQEKEWTCRTCKAGFVRCDDCDTAIPGLADWPTGIHQCWTCFNHGRGAGRLRVELLEAVVGRVPEGDQILFSIGRKGVFIVALRSGVLKVWTYLLGSRTTYVAFRDMTAIDLHEGPCSSVVMFRMRDGRDIHAIELFNHHQDREVEADHLERLRSLFLDARSESPRTPDESRSSRTDLNWRPGFGTRDSMETR
jgi:hypothetical protein